MTPPLPSAPPVPPARDRHLVFSGEVLAGFAVDTVRQALGQRLKLDAQRLDNLFSGRPVIVKRRLTPDQAAAWERQFEVLGARLHVLPMPATDPAPEPATLATDSVPLAADPVPTASLPPPRRTGPPVPVTDAPLFGLSFQGRVGRVRNFLGGLLVLLGLLWLVILVAALPGPITLILLLLGTALLTVWGCRLTVLRLHDVNRSGWWSLVFLVPYVGALASLVLSLLPGTPEDNDHGAPPVDDTSLPVMVVLVLVCISLGAGGRLALSSYERYASQVAHAGTEAETELGQENGLPAQAGLVHALYSDAAAAEFVRYRAEPGHRAFAVSSDGAWGWKANTSDRDQATRAALSACDRRREAYSTHCRIVHVDDAWALY